MRIMSKRRMGSKYEARKGDQYRRQVHLANSAGHEKDELEGTFADGDYGQYDGEDGDTQEDSGDESA